MIESYKNNCSGSTPGSCIAEYNPPYSIEIGTLGAHTRQNILQPVPFRTNRDGTGHYNVRVFAQNGQAIEELWFRPSTVHPGVAYRFRVVRSIRRQPRKTDIVLRTEIFEVLKTVDWTEYSPSESKDGKTPYTGN